MADIREQDLALKTAISDTDWIRLVTPTGNHRMTVGQFKDLIGYTQAKSDISQLQTDVANRVVLGAYQNIGRTPQIEGLNETGGSFLQFYNLNNATRMGYVGFGSASNSVLNITDELGNGMNFKTSGIAIIDSKLNEVNLTLQNGWVNYDVNWQSVRVYKTPSGEVHVQGMIKDGTLSTGTILTTLPTAFRPPKTVTFPIVTNVGVGAVNIFPSGNIQLQGQLPVNSWVSLSGIVFNIK